ncbi:12178_t:CDS:1, partial [Dentiscutata heterogama]
SSQTTSGLYRSVHSKLLTAHQDVNENSSKASRVASPVLGNEKNKSVTNPVIGNLDSSRHTRVEDDDFHDEYMNKSGGGINESGETKETIAYNDEKFMCNFEKSRKGKEKAFQPTVHNTRSRSELSKSTNCIEKM